MEQVIVLKYDGLSAKFGEMDAHEAAESIRGFADFTRRLAEAVYGGKEAQVQSAVRGIHHGSVEFEFVFKFLVEGAGMLASVWPPSVSPMDLIKVLTECIKLLKHLGGQPPASIKKADHGSVYVENNTGQVINIGQLTVNLVLENKEVSRAAQKFVKRPLERSADEVKIMVDSQEVANINREEAQSFVPIDASNILIENTAEVYLSVGTAVLQGKTRWRFTDGRNHFSAQIEDLDFLGRVERGEERFGRGDVMLVKLRTTQKQAGGKLRAEYTIEEVLDHTPAQQTQGRLF
ncbi:hypothetical protein Sp245p_28860 (plasmid) [Azospirillum baldaniorum]|uniref:Uncharacterized protein n=1 Tax=Azospirillum baldaniorum TaxID=1064539 RepID=A0A9P1JY26_9PROT|nr:hypothetical protein [Azospirillum baldaniorum]AWJ93833.1 hypothetical protein Sp245p_28860 [Azospirillum baldaniorum]TWA81656.1 hypothetical protein FBZ85_10230 [Azospirillum brasilense]CCD01991.1 conserved protein of unknown function [Azospirillum baldaniorum]